MGTLANGAATSGSPATPARSQQFALSARAPTGTSPEKWRRTQDKSRKGVFRRAGALFYGISMKVSHLWAYTPLAYGSLMFTELQAARNSEVVQARLCFPLGPWQNRCTDPAAQPSSPRFLRPAHLCPTGLPRTARFLPAPPPA